MEYVTFKENGTVQEEIKKSKFICHVKRVSSEEEARDFINAIKKEHYKATHNCSCLLYTSYSPFVSSIRNLYILSPPYLYNI